VNENHTPALPANWTWTTIGVVVDRKVSQEGPTGGEFTYVDISSVNNSEKRITDPKSLLVAEAPSRARQVLVTGDVLVSMTRPNLNAVALVTPELHRAIGSTGFDVLRTQVIDPRWLYYAVQTNAFVQAMSQLVQGALYPAVRPQDIRSYPLVLPPLNEQRRIVARVEELFSDLNAAVAALERVRAKLKRYRASVLQAAIDGKLTAEWRSRHQALELGTPLLDRILAERRRRWEEAHRAKFSEAKAEPLKNWQGKYQEPKGPGISGRSRLPEGWCWVSLGQLLHGIEGGKSFKCLPRKAMLDEWGVIKVSAMTWGQFLEDEQKAIPPHATFDPADEVKPGDLLLSRSNTAELVGATVLVEECRPRLLLSDKSLRLAPSESLDRRWLHGALSSPMARRQLSRMATGTSNSMRNVSQDKIESVVIPLPPLAEQKRIVVEIEGRLSVLDQFAAQVDANLKRAARLRQSILKRAFEGKLVPQVVTDEPATALLERLRRQREQAAGPETAAEGHKPGKRRREPSEVFFRRVAVVTYVVQRMSDDPSFGRTKLEKILHLTQTHLTYPLGLEFERYAAGPFDALIYKDEAVARKRGWFETKDRPSFGVTYHPGPNVGDLCQRAIGYLGDKQAALDELLGQLRAMNTDDAELLATVYAAWNDLLIDGRPADEEAVIAEVYGWDESKRRFSRTEILARIAWMRQHGYVPAGQGQRTTVLKKKVKLPSSRKKPSR